MHAIGLPRTAVWLVVLGLLAAAAPAAAAPDRAVGEPGIAPPLFQALTAWLAALWPGGGPTLTSAPAWAASAAGPTVEPQLGGEIDPNGGPTVEPQHGIDLDPNG
jgi:hypothetical protein